MEKTLEQKMAEYKDMGFDGSQLRQIRLGYEYGLTSEQVTIYAKKEFDDDQMLEIRLGYESGLTDEQVSTYAKAEFDCEAMEQKREKLKNENPDYPKKNKNYFLEVVRFAFQFKFRK